MSNGINYLDYKTQDDRWITISTNELYRLQARNSLWKRTNVPPFRTDFASTFFFSFSQENNNGARATVDVILRNAEILTWRAMWKKMMTIFIFA